MQVEKIYSKIANHSKASKCTSERIDKMVSEFLQIRKQNLTMGSKLEHICQHLGVTAGENNGGGGFSVSFYGPKNNEPYRPPNMREVGNSLNTALETPFLNEGNGIPVTRTSLDPSKRVLFFKEAREHQVLNHQSMVLIVLFHSQRGRNF